MNCFPKLSISFWVRLVPTEMAKGLEELKIKQEEYKKGDLNER